MIVYPVTFNGKLVGVFETERSAEEAISKALSDSRLYEVLGTEFFVDDLVTGVLDVDRILQEKGKS